MPVGKTTSSGGGQTGKNPLLAKYGNALTTAAKKHAKDEVRYGRARIPPGINNGVAQLTKVGFGQVEQGKANAGEYYFRAEGTVIEPESVVVNGVSVPCRGMMTSIIEMVCQTKNSKGEVTTLEEHVGNIQNTIRMIAGEDFDVEDLWDGVNNLQAIIDQGNGPFFHFSTSLRAAREYFDPKTKQKKMSEEGVWENWHGSKGLEDYAPQTGRGVTDQTGGPTGEAQPSANGSGDGGHEEQTEAAPSEGDDLEHLVATADDDEASRARLKELAMQAGMDEGEVDMAKSWQEVADFISAQAGSTEESTSDGDEPWSPSEGEQYNWKPTVVNPKTKKKSKGKAVGVEVTAVDADKEKVDVKRLDNHKVQKGVPWTDLEPME